jgi:hypothetical protein
MREMPSADESDGIKRTAARTAAPRRDVWLLNGKRAGEMLE